MSTAAPIFIVGDSHGQWDKLIHLLRQADLVSSDLHWAGRDATLWFMGDFFDRGPDGVGCVDVVMRLQAEARQVGGRVASLLGNHDLLILAARRFGALPVAVPGHTFRSMWEVNGGQPGDLARLTEAHVDWLAGLPAMARLGDTLLAHADAMFYLRYGQTVTAVNQAFRALLSHPQPEAWDRLLGEFAERLAFVDTDSAGLTLAQRFLTQYGAARLVNGHTPIGYARSIPHASVTEAWVYAGGLCINVDGGMYMGGPGFVYELVRRGEQDDDSD